MNNGRRKAVELWFLFWIGIAIIAVTLGLIGLYYLRWPMLEWLRERIFTGYLDSRYLLSATAQVLGALFALVFTITLIAVQFVTKYTHRTMKIIFNWRLIFYMAGFACSVILPLWWLLNPTELGTYISIVTGSLVVLSLILLFLDLKKRMNIGWIITYLKEEGLKAVNTKDFKKAEKNINALDNIGMGAYTDRNYEVFELAVTALADFALGIEKKHKKIEGDRIRLHNSIFERLFSTYAEVVDNPRAPELVLKHLERIGVDAVKQGFDSTWSNVSIYVEAMEKLTIKEASTPISNHKRNLSSYCGFVLHKLAVILSSTTKITEKEMTVLLAEKRIHERHLDNKWEKWLIIHLRHTVELVIKYMTWIEHVTIKGLFDTLTKQLFDYLEHFVNQGVPKGIHYYQNELNPLLSAIEEGEYYNLPGLLIDALGKYGKNCLAKEAKVAEEEGDVDDAEKEKQKKKEEKNWWTEGMNLLFLVAKLGSYCLKHEYYDLCLKAIEAYKPVILPNDKFYSNFTAAFALPQLLSDQSRELLEKGQLTDEELVKEIIQALEYGVKTYIDGKDSDLAKLIAEKNKKENIVQMLWEKVTPLIFELLKLGLEKKWWQVVSQAYFFYRNVSWYNVNANRPLPQLELLKGIWVTVAALIAPPPSPQKIDPIHGIAVSIRNYNLDEEFYQAYKDTSLPAKELGLEEWIGRARSLIDRKRRDLGYPSYP